MLTQVKLLKVKYGTIKKDNLTDKLFLFNFKKKNYNLAIKIFQIILRILKFRFNFLKRIILQF
jgi:hypothetical protein